MLLLSVYILLAIGVSFVCSVLEAVLLSISPSYVASLRQQGSPAADKLAALKEDIDRPLASILTLNTIAHTIGAASAGAQAAVVFGSQWLGVFSGVLTLAILLFSEIIPKTLGATYWRELAIPSVKVLKWMVWLLTPFVWASEQLTRRLSHGHQPPKLRDELSAMAMLAKESGELAEGESKILTNLLEFRDVKVTQIMTPRPVLFRVSAEMTVEQFLTEHADTPFSRPLLYQEDNDNIMGFVHRLTLFAAQRAGHGKRQIGHYAHTLPVLHSGVTVPYAFEQLCQRHSQLGLIVDEYGSVQGLVTLEDIFETLAGVEIVDEADTTSDMQALAQQRWEQWKQDHKVIDGSDDEDEDDHSNEGDESAEERASEVPTTESDKETGDQPSPAPQTNHGPSDQDDTLNSDEQSRSPSS